MKRFLSLILAIAMTCSMLTACGNGAKVTNVLADKSLREIQEAIYKEVTPQFPLMDMEVDFTDENAVKYYTGLSGEDAGKVKEALASEPMMGSQAYSMVLLRLNDAKDAEAIANAVKEGVDPRKWICVEADTMRVCAHGDVVMFVMVASVFEDIPVDKFADAFKNVAEGTLSVDLK